MRAQLAGAACILLGLAGCSGGNPNPTDPTTPIQDPIANAGGPYAGMVGKAVSFNGAASVDPQGETLTYAWSFGDNTFGSGATPTHTYTGPGAYTIGLNVMDTSNAQGTASSQAIISVVSSGSVNGVVYDGGQPISGAHVYLFAASTAGYGQASVSLMQAAATGHSDAVGAYVLTSSDGGFVWTGDYSCTPGTQVYAYALGGTTAAGTNSATGLLAVLGACPGAGNFAALPYVWINEVSTVAAAYAFAGFASDATHVASAGTALAQVGIAIAFANAANLVSLPAGVALAVTPGGNGAVPQSEINTLANILAACVDSNGPASGGCSTLFEYARVSGSYGAMAADTAGAAINIAHNPGVDVTVLYAIPAASGAFAPALSSQPNDFTIAINFTGGGLHVPLSVAIDGAGAAWATDSVGSAVSELASTGLPISSVSGIRGGGVNDPNGIAIDASGNAWVANTNGMGETEFSSVGNVLSPASGFPFCGIDNSRGVAIDGLGNAWFTISYGGLAVDAEGLANAGCITELTSAGAPISGGYAFGYLDQPLGIAIDGQNNVWVVNQAGNSITELSSSGVPISPFAGFAGGGLNDPINIAIDSAGDAWVTNASALTSSISEFAPSGAPMSPPYGFTGAGLNDPQGIAIDGSGNVWAANYHGNNVTELGSNGAAVSPAGYTSAALKAPAGIAVDGSGDVWVANNGGNSLVEFIGAATPVVVPLAVGVANHALGARP